MTVRELIEELEQFDPDMTVVSIDEYGYVEPSPVVNRLHKTSNLMRLYEREPTKEDEVGEDVVVL